MYSLKVTNIGITFIFVYDNKNHLTYREHFIIELTHTMKMQPPTMSETIFILIYD